MSLQQLFDDGLSQCRDNSVLFKNLQKVNFSLNNGSTTARSISFISPGASVKP